MKIPRKPFLIMLLLIVFSGCNEITVTTRVNKDGSFTRLITVKGEKTSIDRQILPYPVDSTWAKELLPDSTDTTKYVLSYTKKFRNSAQLNREISSDTSWFRRLNRNIEVKKGFGFFFSYLVYKETYHAPIIFNRLNYKDFLSHEDILFFSGEKIPVSKDDSVKFNNASQKVDDFFSETFTAEIMLILQDGIKRLNDPSLSADQVITFKDSIKNMSGEHLLKGESFIDLYKDLTGNPAVEKLNEIQPPIFDDFYKKAHLFISITLMEDFVQTIEMPGIITATNSTLVSGNKVNWEISSNRCFFTDYEMMVESRVINTWAFVVTGLVVLGLLVLLIFKAWK